MEHLTHSAAETEALGCRLGCALAPGTVIAYRGGLGMGKTAFTRGLARGLDCRDRVTSPTFTIVNEYQGRIPLFHFDMYRLPTPCLTSGGRIIWTVAACAPWSGARTWPRPCRRTPCGWTSAGWRVRITDGASP